MYMYVYIHMYMYIIHTCTVHYTFLVVEEAVVPHEHPVVVEGGRGSAGMEHGWMVLEEVLEVLQVARISLRREEEGGREGREGERKRRRGEIGREGERERTGKEGEQKREREKGQGRRESRRGREGGRDERKHAEQLSKTACMHILY